MRTRTLILSLFAVLGAVPARAQRPEEVSVLTAATVFVRDSLIAGHGRIVIDETFHRVSPGVDAATANEVARSTGAKVGRWEETLKCTNGQKPRCEGQGATVIAFARPGIDADRAVLDLSYHYVDVRERPQMSQWQLTLTRGQGGTWRVTSVRETGAS